MEKKLNLIELNEINFDIIKRYVNIDPQQFLGFSKLLSLKEFKTYSEDRYELIEPWIQWASVHTEKSYSEHKIFRLGDIVDFKGIQIFEAIESLGFKVGCVSPMNAENKLKNLNQPPLLIIKLATWPQLPTIIQTLMQFILSITLAIPCSKTQGSSVITVTKFT